MHMTRAIAILAAALALVACGAAQDDPAPAAPVEAAPTPAGVAADGDVAADTPARPAVVAAAHPEATAAGVKILRAGGSAVDAAVAVLATLSLVEPQSAGFGGGAFMLHFDAETRTLMVYDGRETAPAGASAAMFLGADGEPWGFLDAKHSGVAIGVPGAVDMLSLAHADHGVLRWADLFDHAIALAEDGFAVTPRLNDFITRFGRLLPATPEDGPTDVYAYLMPGGEALAVGALRDNPAYAETLRAIAADPRALYEGPLATEIVAQAALAPRPGTLSAADMADYRARVAQPLCTPYRGMSVCGAPPPSSGGVAVGQILALLAASEDGFVEGGAQRAENWSLFAQAQLLAYADRDQYLADDAFTPVPMRGLLHPDYLAERAAQMSRETPLTAAEPGDPWAYQAPPPAPVGADASVETPGTTHFVIVDAAGDVVSLTASVESIFGSSRMAGGMILNNQLTDFARQPRDDAGVLRANAAAPGKRPRSSMSPTIVLNAEGAFHLATGSPGGSSIIAYTAKTLIGVLDWGLSPQDAVELPNMVARGATVRIEQDRASAELIAAMSGFGFAVKESAGENSGVHMVLRHSDGTLEAGVDPRREGVAAAP